MRAFVPSLFLIAMFAGCIDTAESPDEPDPTEFDWAANPPFSVLLCTDGYASATDAPARIDRCNHRVTKPLLDANVFDWQSQHGPGNEVSIAVNPTNPLNAIGGAKDYTVSYISDTADCGEFTVWMGAFATFDGGLTWTNDLIPGFPGDPRESPLHGNLCNTDPVMAFDDDGTAWFHALNYDGTRDDAPLPVTHPFGPHDAYTGSQLYFAKSPDGGATYPGADITFASFGDDAAIFNDKNWFALQPGGDHMIATWSNFLIEPATGAFGSPVIMFTESQDAGATWSAPREIPMGAAANALSVQFSMPQYLPGGNSVAVIWADFASSGVRGGAGLDDAAQLAYTEGVVTPGGTAFRPAVRAFEMNPLKSGPGRDGTGPSTFRLSTYPVLAVDTSGGDCDGRRYVVWSDQPGPVDSDVQVLMRYSDDGMAWSDAVTLNDVAHGDQLMPWIDVDENGGVHATWYDRRNDPENRLLDVYYAYAEPCGESWYPNVRVTETSFDGDLGHHQNGSPFLGDYIGVDATAELAYVFWADTRHSCAAGVCEAPMRVGSDVYSATLLAGESAAALFAP